MPRPRHLIPCAQVPRCPAAMEPWRPVPGIWYLVALEGDIGLLRRTGLSRYGSSFPDHRCKRWASPTVSRPPTGLYLDCLKQGTANRALCG